MSTRRVFIGCYTQQLPFVAGCGEGIRAADVNLDTGELVEVPGFKPTSAGPNPTYLTTNKAKTHLYVVSENYGSDSKISTFTIESDGNLTLKGTPVDAKGEAACYIVLDQAERHAFVANYMSGSTIVLSISADGSLASTPAYFAQYPKSDKSDVDPGRQADGCHAHQVVLDPSETYCYVPDLGSDMVRQYSYDASCGTLKALDPVGVKMLPGSGPRHMVFHPSLPKCYVVNELLSTVTVCTQDKQTGILTAADTFPTLPDGVKVGADPESTCAAIRISSDGQNLYCSNRGHDSITRFHVDKDGSLKFADRTKSGGKTPRDFILVESKLMIIANQDSNSIDTFFINEDGTLNGTGHSLNVGTPSVVALF